MARVTGSALRFGVMVACIALIVVIAVWHFGFRSDEGQSWNRDWSVQWQLSPATTVFGSYSFSPDSKHFAAVDRTGKVLIYETSSCSLVSSWDTGHAKAYGAICDPSGRWLATKGLSPTIQVWDLKTHQLAARLDGDELKIGELCWSPDGKVLMAISNRSQAGEIILWNALTMQQIALLRGHTDVVTGAEWSPQGDVIASVGYDGTLRVWDAKTFVPLKVLHEHPDRILCMAFTPDGKYLATGGLRSGGLLSRAGHKNLLIWDANEWRVIHRLDNEYNVMGLECLPHGKESHLRCGRFRRRGGCRYGASAGRA